MPQLAKGGKHVFGWSRVGAAGEVRIPPEAVDEYRLGGEVQVILTSGSKTSGGFVLIREDVMAKSPLGAVLEAHSEICPREGGGAVGRSKQRLYSRARLCGGRLALSAQQSSGYCVWPGDLLLVVRGSGLGPGLLARGPLIEEARRHAELEVFEPLVQTAG